MEENINWVEEKFLKGKNPFIWIITIGVLVYFWTIFFGFSYFDDKTLILDNLFFLKNLGNIFQAFTFEVFHVLHASAAYYRPILTVSFILDAQISGANPFFYHFTNLVIHLITSCLVYVFLRKLEIKKELAFVFSLVFSVHPVLIQAVAWIPGRNDSLLALFTLASMIQIIEAVETGETKHLIWHSVFFTLALFTKESGLLIPPMIIIYILMVRKRPLHSIKPTVFLGWIVTIVIWYFLRKIALQNPIPYRLPEILTSLYLEFPATLLYLGKVFFPVNLSVLPILQDSTLIYGFVATLLVIVLLLTSKKKNLRLIAFGILLFFGFLLPSFIRPNVEYAPDFLEHRIYLPIVGLFIVLSEIKIVKDMDFTNKKVTFGIGAFILILMIINLIHTANFRDKIVFWENAVRSSPHHPLAHKNLGAMYYLDGRFDEAVPEYKKSLELNPKETMVHNNLGLIYLTRKDFARAEDEFKKELEINPTYDNAFFNYGLLLYQKGKVDEAEKMWLKTLEVNPDYIDAMKNLLVIYSQKKDQIKVDYYYNELLKRGINLNSGF